MVKFSLTEHIKSSPQDVFDYVADPARLAEWQSNTEHAEWISNGQPGIGSTFKVVTVHGDRKTEVVMQITHWEPPYLHGFKSVQVPFPVESVSGITTLSPSDDGAQITLESEVAARGIFKLLEGVLASQVKKQDESNLNNLKQMLEAAS